MADEGAEPEDISSMMEALWGPRSGSPVEDVVLGIPEDDLWGPRRNGDPPTAGERKAPEPAPPAGGESVRGAPDELFRESIAALLRTVEARHAESIQLAKADLDAFRAHIDVAMGEFADSLAGATEEAVSAADARVAGAETRLLGRLDAIAAGVASAVQEASLGHEALARLAVVEREAAERETALAQRLELETQRLTQAVEELRAQSATPAGLDAIRAETGGTAAALAPAEANVDGLAEQLAEATTVVAALATSVGAAMSRLDALDQRVAEKIARPAPEVVDLVGLRSEVEADVARMIEARGTETERAIDSRVREAEVELAQRLAQVVTPADLDALRAETGVQVGGAISGVTSRLDALDRRVAKQKAQPAPETVDLVGLRSEFTAEIERAVTSETDVLTRSQADLSRQLADVVERLEHLQAAVDRATSTEEADGLAAREARMQAAIDDLAAAVESQRRERKAKVSEAPATSLLQDLEARARETDADVAEMHELHDALDIGLGTLRSEIAELRGMTKKLAGDQADLFDRLESSAQPTAVTEVEKGRGRRGSGR